MKKIKPLLPSLREKKRYLSFEILEDNPIDLKLAKDTILDNFIDLFGEFGAANAGIVFMEKLYKQNRGIMKVNNRSLNDLRGSLTTIKNLNVKSVIASGVLDKVKNITFKEIKNQKFQGVLIKD